MNNIEINDKLETDIENKYIKYKENVKFTTEEAIYILKRKDFCDEVENIAIENLIQENKELKEDRKLAYNLGYRNGCNDTSKFNDKEFIRKSKVKEKIEELEKDVNDFEEYWSKDPRKFKKQKSVDYYKLEALKELLEEGE